MVEALPGIHGRGVMKALLPPVMGSLLTYEGRRATGASTSPVTRCRVGTSTRSTAGTARWTPRSCTWAAPASSCTRSPWTQRWAWRCSVEPSPRGRLRCTTTLSGLPLAGARLRQPGGVVRPDDHDRRTGKGRDARAVVTEFQAARCVGTRRSCHHRMAVTSPFSARRRVSRLSSLSGSSARDVLTCRESRVEQHRRQGPSVESWVDRDLSPGNRAPTPFDLWDPQYNDADHT